MQLSKENQRRLEAFRDRHGRAPRILHIGNIANNAYNNAKLLNEAGLDCDVICYDYYHIMGCPEWEDADFDATGIDHFKPDWTAIDLKGFKRPRWFAQGPQQLCIDYLIAKRTGDTAHANSLWQKLGYVNRTARLSDENSLSEKLTSFTSHQLGRAKRILATFLTHPDVHIVVWDKLGRLASRYGIWGYLGMAIIAPVAALFYLPTMWLLKLTWCAWQLVCAEGACTREDVLPAAWARLGGLIRQYGPLGFFIAMIIAPVFMTAVAIGRKISPGDGEDSSLDEQLIKYIHQFAEWFPGRQDKLSKMDFEAYFSVITRWKKLFEYYDAIIAYSTDGIYPLLAETPYIAFEHGTIRDIPYQFTPHGRLTALTYRCAYHVLVTNSDCMKSAEYLAPARHTLINHPYDEDHGLQVKGSKELRAKLLAELESDFLFFFPTRQDWVSGTGYADKANDVFLRAFAELREKGWKVGLICCAWGSNISQSQSLLKDMECQKYVKWIAPLAIIPFERMSQACDCVVDQFKLGAFGGVLFKAMSAGVPIVTYLDEKRIKGLYEELPPVINCQTREELVVKLLPLLAQPDLLMARKEESRNWIKRFHGKEDIVNKQLDILHGLMLVRSQTY